jgi:hypothetical protein
MNHLAINNFESFFICFLRFFFLKFTCIFSHLSGRSWKQCYKRVSSLRLRHYLQAPFHFYQTNTSPRRSNKEVIYKIILGPVRNVPVLQTGLFLCLTIVMYLCYMTGLVYELHV